MKRILIDGNWNSTLAQRAKFVMSVMPDRFYLVSVAGPLDERGNLNQHEKCEWNFIRMRNDGMKARVVVNATLREMENAEWRTGIIDIADRDLRVFLKELPHIEEFVKQRLASPILLED
jgi:hypothetical protein